MTVVAYRAGIIAADSQISRGGERSGHVCKIRKTPRGLAGAAGDVSAVVQFLRWFEAGERTDAPPDLGNAEFTAVVVRPDGKLVEYDHDMTPFSFEHGFAAIGCGGPYALGAMSAGADAIRAAEIALEHHTGCGGRIDVLRLHG